MKQAIGTLTFLLITACAWAQNSAAVLQNTKAKAQSLPGQTQVHSSSVPVKAKQPVQHSVTPAAKPVAHKAISKKPVEQKLVAQKPAAQKSAPSKAVSVASSAKPTPVTRKANAVRPEQVKSAAAQKPQIVLKPVAMKSAKAELKPVAAKMPAKAAAVTNAKSPVVAKTLPEAKAKDPVANKPTAVAKVDVKDSITKPDGSEKEKKEEGTSSKLITGVGKRDPFVSPVVSQSMSGSGCSVGKKCLAIDQITIRGVVKSDSGMIAVVVNALDKAYFLRENDPVFNGYVEKITEDSIIFKEMYQDKLGKSFTRDVTKRIQAPVV